MVKATQGLEPTLFKKIFIFDYALLANSVHTCHNFKTLIARYCQCQTIFEEFSVWKRFYLIIYFIHGLSFL